MENKEIKRIEVETPFGTLIAEPSGGDPQYPGIWISLLRKEKDADYPDRFIGGNYSIGKDNRIEQQLVLVEAVMEDPSYINADTDRGTLFAKVWDDPDDEDPRHSLVFESKPLRFDIEKVEKGDIFMTADGEYHTAGEDAHKLGEARFQDEWVVYDDEGNSFFASDFDDCGDA